MAAKELTRELLDELETDVRAKLNATAGLAGNVLVSGADVLSLLAAARELEELRPYAELKRGGITTGGAQQAWHMAHAACEALGLDYDDTAPVDIADAILKPKRKKGPTNGR